MKIRIMLPGNYLQHNISYLEFYMFALSFISKDYNHPVRLLLIDARGFDGPFLIPLIITFISTLYIRYITLHCYHIYLFRSESWSSRSVMAIPNWRLNSTATEFQREEGKTANQHTVMREQIDSPRSRESACLRSRPGREFRAYRLFHSQGKLRENIRMNYRAFLSDVKAVHSF
jgi:hypothetical protein